MKGASTIVNSSDERASAGDRGDAVVVRLPEGPPILTPPAARALLHLLRKAGQRDGEPLVDDNAWKDAA